MSVIVLGDYYLGKWELLKPDQRNASWDLSDSTVTTTWEEVDLTAVIGTDVAAVLGMYEQVDNAATDSSILVAREVGSSLATNSNSARLSRLTAEIGAQGNIVINNPIFILCRGTDPGKFEYAEWSTSHPVVTFAFQVWGRVRP